jgi:hypothetical protein
MSHNELFINIKIFIVMKLFNIYKDIILEHFEGLIDETTTPDSRLTELLDISKKVIFDRFGIAPDQKVYFIAGSARLYLYPKLKEVFGLDSSIGDLDIVIPDKKYWDYGKVPYGSPFKYKTNGAEIEAFNDWDPSKAGGQWANFQARPTTQILHEATYINGYWFMPLRDIVHYKTGLNREKEQDIVNIMNKYSENPKSFIKQIGKELGHDDTKDFLSIGK